MFFVYQEHADVRMRKISADVSNINTASELRLNNLEQRVIAIEKKLLLNPPAACPKILHRTRPSPGGA